MAVARVVNEKYMLTDVVVKNNKVLEGQGDV